MDTNEETPIYSYIYTYTYMLIQYMNNEVQTAGKDVVRWLSWANTSAGCVAAKPYGWRRGYMGRVTE